MPLFLPFKALRPTKETVAKFSAKTSDFKNHADVLTDMKTNTESYYYVTKQRLLSTAKKPLDFFFTLGANFINDKINKKELFQDNTSCYYIYRQIDHISGRIYTGLIGLADVLDFENNRIKKHEQTKLNREEYLYKQLHFTEVLGEPVLMGYQFTQSIDQFIAEETLEIAEYDFKSIDGKEHLVWVINDSYKLEIIKNNFIKIPAFYIADGHHRCASAIRNYSRNTVPTNQHFMIFLLSENQFHMESFHRLVSMIEPDIFIDLKAKIEKYFEVEDFIKGELFIPQEPSQFGLLTRDLSLRLTYKKVFSESNAEAQLDVLIIEKKILKPIINILHPTTDKRLSYISSKEDFAKTKNRLAKGKIDLVISNFPLSFDLVKKVADAGKTLPPKSTYIEPKLRGGLIVQKF